MKETHVAFVFVGMELEFKVIHNFDANNAMILKLSPKVVVDEGIPDVLNHISNMLLTLNEIGIIKKNCNKRL